MADEKYYQLGTHDAAQWLEIHNQLCEATSGIANIPDRVCTCYDDKIHSPTRGTFLLTDEEAATLKNDPRIKFLNIDYSSYPETYKAPPDELQSSSPDLLNRFKGSVKVYREFEVSNTLPGTPGSDDYNRTGYQLLRPMQKLDPWVANSQADNYVYPSNIEQFADGRDVDIIVADDGAGWIGHPEFQNNCTGSSNPWGYTGGNKLPGNGTCDVLDLLLDGPGYLDPDFFYPTPNVFPRSVYATPVETTNYTLNTGSDRNGTGGGADYPIRIFVGDTLRITNTSPEGSHPLYLKTAQTTGTGDLVTGATGQGAVNNSTVIWTPTEAGTYYYQCGTHLSMSGTITVELGDYIEERWDGTIVPKETNARNWWISPANRSDAFNAKYPSAGTIPFITSSYTRANCNGSNTAQSAVGEHCTPCMALTYGRTQGWAYNANKWVLNLYGTYGSDIEYGFDIQKIFHNTKPVNAKYNTQDPTVSSNSWGYRASKGDVNGYYHFRTDAAVQYSGTGNEPQFISHMGTQGDAGRWKSEMKTNSLTTALDELIAAGVIFVCAAGNSNQKQTNWGHPDFDNYISANSDDTIEESSYSEFGISVTGTTNRRGFPQQGGKHDLSDGLGSDFFKRELTVNGVRIVGAGSVGGQVAVPDAWLEKVGRMFELFLDKNAAGINEAAQRTVIQTLSGDTGTYHAGFPTLQRVARGAGADYSTNFLTDPGIIYWNLTNLFDTHVQNDMVWYLNSTGDGYGDGDNDAQEVIEHVFHTLHMHGLDAVSLKLYSYISADWASGPLYAAMEEAYDAGMWDSSGYGGDTWKTDGDAFEVAAKEYLFLLNFAMFEYTELWDGGSLAPEWSDLMRTQAGILENNPLGYALHNTYIAPVISKPSLATIRSIFQDGNTPAQDNPSLAGVSGYVVSNGSTQDPEYNNGPLISNGEVAYKTINIGALDDDYAASKEAKVGYSDRGSGIDVYFPADGTLAANRSYTPEGTYPVTYPGFTANSGSGAGVPEDCAFGGTSAACPVAAGFITCLVGLNRNWTYSDVLSYFQSLDNQASADFYYGLESSTATDSNWLDYNSLEGGDAKVGYQDLTKITQTSFPKRTSTLGAGITIKNAKIVIKQRFDRG